MTSTARTRLIEADVDERDKNLFDSILRCLLQSVASCLVDVLVVVISETTKNWSRCHDHAGTKGNEKCLGCEKHVSDTESNEELGGGCCICLEKLYEYNSVRFDCSHAYHRKCISTWLQNHDSCPICSRPLIK